MKTKFGTIIIATVLALSVGGPGVSARVGPLVPRQATERQSQTDKQPQLPTPQLIEAARSKGEIDPDTANLYLAYALTDYEKLPAQYRSNVPWDGTLPLLRLQETVKTMKASSTRAEIAKMLSGTCSTSTGTLPNNTSSTHFYVEYNTIGGGLTISSYTTSLETAWTKEITTFGWAAPPVLTGSPPPGNLYHVRIDTLSSGLYGYVSNSGTYAGLVGDNPNTSWNDVDAYATCMVLNRDYSGFPGTPQTALDATTAHEFNHSIQFGIGALTGSNAAESAFTEGGASWMEDEVFDSANDNYNYLWPTFNMCMGEYTNSPYPYWITWRGFTERYGTGIADGGEQVMQDFWEETSKGTGDNLSAMNTALVNKGTNLANAYHAYAIAVKFNKTCGGGYVYPYCFEEAASYLSAAGATPVHGAISLAGSSYSGSVQDNYALNWVSLPTSGGPYTVTLQNTSGGGQLRGSVVCDTGSALSVTPLPAVVGAGASTALANFNPSGCTSVVAVITNQSQTANNPSSCTARSYLLKTGGSASLVYLPIIIKPSPPPSTLYSVGDACVLQGYPSQNSGGTSDMWAGYDDYLEPDGKIVRSLIQFNTTAIPAGTTINSAALQVYLVGSWDYPSRARTITAYRIGSSWSESSVVWNTQPSIAEAYGSASITAGAWGWYSFDVTNLVRGWVNGTWSNYGVALRGPEWSGSDSSWRSFSTREGSYTPQLVISYPGSKVSIGAWVDDGSARGLGSARGIATVLGGQTRTKLCQGLPYPLTTSRCLSLR